MQPSRPASPPASEAWQPDVVAQQAAERLTREEKKARTRAQLIDAAATVFARRGFAAASLDDVADEAGLTKGAVYSNFESKQELFQAVIDDRLNRPMMAAADVIDEAGGTIEEQAMQGARMYGEVVEQERDLFLLALEYDIYCARNPDFEAAFAGGYRDRLAHIAELIADHAHRSGVAMPLSPIEMATVVTALSQGMGLQKLRDPERVPDDLLGRVYALLFQHLQAPESTG
jgi:AcrR family transcriptional regulator